jgi:hypothetical protein
LVVVNSIIHLLLPVVLQRFGHAGRALDDDAAIEGEQRCFN